MTIEDDAIARFELQLAELIDPTADIPHPAGSESSAARTAAPSQPVFNLVRGGDFILDGTPDLEARWGDRADVLWACGESLLVVAPPGAGKTTIAVQLVEALVGITDRVLDLPVRPARRVLYLAMDRPRQIRRAMARRFRAAHLDVLNDRLVVQKGPLISDLAKIPDQLRRSDVSLPVGSADGDRSGSLGGPAVEGARRGARQGAALHREAAQLAQNVADKTVELRVQQDLANGVITSAATKTDLYNSSMITAAAQASGPYRQAIIDHIAAVNQIPAEKATEIQALIDQGKIDEANYILALVSAAREASIKADADDASAKQARKDIENTVKGIVANVGASFSGVMGTNWQGKAVGTLQSSQDTYIAGENGPELITNGRGSRVYTTPETAKMLGASSGRQTVIHVGGITVAKDTTAAQIVDELLWRSRVAG